MPLPSGRPKISNETPGPALAILSICSAGASALVAGSAIAYHLKHRDLVRGSKLELGWNVLLSFALAVCIAQSAVTAVEVEYGLGYPIGMLSPDGVAKFLKLEYANNLLYVGAVLLLKGAQSVIQVKVLGSRPNYWVPAIVMPGMLAFFVAAAFHCHSPFWKLRGNQCIGQTTIWIAFGIFDIVSDICSVSIVLWKSAGLNMVIIQKIKLLIIVAMKFLPVACAIARLPFVHAAYNTSDYTIALYKLGIPTQLQLHLSVAALSLGKIFQFLNLFDVGYLSSAIEPTHGKGTVNQSHVGTHKHISKLSNHPLRHHTSKQSISDHDSSKHLVPGGYGHTTTEVEGLIPMQRMGDAPLKQLRPHSRGQNGGNVQEGQPMGNVITVTRDVEIRSEGVE